MNELSTIEQYLQYRNTIISTFMYSQERYQYNGFDQHIFVSQYDFPDLNDLYDVMKNLKNGQSFLLDQITYIEINPAQNVIPLTSVFRAKPTAYAVTTKSIEGRLGFNTTQQDFTSGLLSIEAGDKPVGKIYKRNAIRVPSLLILFYNNKMIQHMSAILLKNVIIYGFEQQVQQEAQPGQFIYNFSQSDMNMFDYPVSQQIYYHNILQKFVTQEEIDQLESTNNQLQAEITKQKEIKVKNERPVINGIITKVIDGDTIVVKFLEEDWNKLGLNSKLNYSREWNECEQFEYRVRLIGIDCPEDTTTHEPFGPEATQFTKGFINMVVPIEFDEQMFDNYNRLLAYVWLAKPNKRDFNDVMNYTLNGQLAMNGLARTMTIWPNVRYSQIFGAIVDAAKKAGIGMYQ